MFNPAFLFPTMTMAPSPASSNSAALSHHSVPASATRKRVRVSELSRKYRNVHGLEDENVLICDTTSSPEPQAQNIRFSRFPDSWPETQCQVLAAVGIAINKGHDRIRVDVKNPHLISPRAALADHVAVGDHCLPRLVETACSILEKVLSMGPIISGDDDIPCRPTSAILHFNTAEDAKLGKSMVPERMLPFTRVHALGDHAGDDADVHIVIAPCNRDGNPERIEDVEAVHYAGWSKSRIIIILNPELIALTEAVAFDGELREPGFLTDYMSSYYIDPAAYPTKAVMGAVLKCFPRKWELYLMQLRGDVGFRLVSEQHKMPSAERLRCLFSWRAEEFGTALSA